MSSSSRQIGQVVCTHKLVFHPKTHPCPHNRCSAPLLKISGARHLTYYPIDKLECAGKGYVKALILDPFEVRIYLLRTSHSSHISITRHPSYLPSLLGLYAISQISHQYPWQPTCLPRNASLCPLCHLPSYVLENAKVHAMVVSKLCLYPFPPGRAQKEEDRRGPQPCQGCREAPRCTLEARSSQPCTGTKVRCVLPLFAGLLSHFYKRSEKCKSLKGKGKEPAGPLVHS